MASTPNTAADPAHRFVLTVSGCSLEQAQQILAERLNHDEDYGVDYQLSYDSTPLSPTAQSSSSPVAPQHRTIIPAQETTLVYVDDHGNEHTQPAGDLVDVGTLIDPEDGSDMELSGVIINDTTL